MDTETKTVVKSAEQNVTEKATEQYMEILKSVYGKDVQIEVSISGVSLSRLGHMAECAGLLIDNTVDHLDNVTHYIRKPFEGNGYKIEEISE
jgi:hypothetical protein